MNPFYDLPESFLQIISFIGGLQVLYKTKEFIKVNGSITISIHIIDLLNLHVNTW